MNERPIDPFLAAWSAASGSDGFASRSLVDRALQEPGPWTRARLHAALAAILVEEPEQRYRFEEVFALWFGAEAGDQQAEILDLDAWLRAPVVQAGQAEDGGEWLAADAKSLAYTPQPVASVPRKRHRPGSWPFSALDATVLLIAVVCLLGDVRRPSPKPGTANAHKSVSDTDSVVEGLILPTQVRNQKDLSASSRRRRTPTEEHLPGSALEEPAEKPQRNRANGFAKPDDSVKRVTAGASPDAELPAGREGIRPQGRGAAAAGAEEPRTAPEAPMSHEQAIQTLSKAGIIKDAHRNGIGGLRWFYSKGSLDPEAILALDSLGASIGLLFLEDSVLQLSPLRSLRRLKGLDLGWTKLSDVSALDGMPLVHLELSGTKVSNLSALKRMPLAYLDLAWTQVSDLSPLAGMRLTYLELGGTKVTDLSPLKGTPLATLSLFRTQVSILSSLKGMPLAHLDLGRTKVSDVSALKGMSLTKLDLKGTAVGGVSALKGMPLQWLDLGGTEVGDVSALSGMPLTRLALGGTKVSDLSALKGMPLQWLDLSGTKVSDLSALKGMPLQWLDLSGTKVSDLSALKGMPLQWLDLSGTKVSDLSALDSLRLLRTLFVRGLLGSVKDWSPVSSGVRITPSPPTRQTTTQATSSKGAP
jgi:Leucine-rich repeat (LRR) protein